jgi:hypothetical protein
MTGGRAIRWSTVLAVAGVALVAGWVSYVHAYDVVRAHGEHGALGRLYPGTIDGLIYSASMVLLDAARRDVKPPPLARWLLLAGIGATLFANVLAGAAFGLLGATVAAWPAAALVGSYELLMWLVRHGVTATPETPGTVSSPVPGDAENAALASLRATLAAGNPWSQNQLMTRFGLTRTQATKVRELVTAEANGQHPQDPGEVIPDS